MVFNNHVLHYVIVGRAVGISPLASMVSVLVGASLGGFVGAMIATPLVSVAHTLLASRRSGSPDTGHADDPRDRRIGGGGLIGPQYRDDCHRRPASGSLTPARSAQEPPRPRRVGPVRSPQAVRAGSRLRVRVVRRGRVVPPAAA